MDGRGWLETARRRRPLLFDEASHLLFSCNSHEPQQLCTSKSFAIPSLTVYNHKATNLNIQITLILKPAKVNKLEWKIEKRHLNLVEIFKVHKYIDIFSV